MNFMNSVSYKNVNLLALFNASEIFVMHDTFIFLYKKSSDSFHQLQTPYSNRPIY